MKNRREFLQALVAVGLAQASKVYGVVPRSRPASPTYTARVRAITRQISVPEARWEWIVAHHSGIKYGNAAIYDRAHRARGMENGLAYHFVIGNGIHSKDGEIEIGPRWLQQLQGGHVHREEINQVGIGICLVGNFEETKPTMRQLAAFRELVDYLRQDVVGRSIRFAVHREIDPGRTVCPGRNFPTLLMHQRYGFGTRLG